MFSSSQLSLSCQKASGIKYRESKAESIDEYRANKTDQRICFLAFILLEVRLLEQLLTTELFSFLLKTSIMNTITFFSYRYVDTDFQYEV